MQTKERQAAAGLIHHLFDEPARYQFRQSLRLLLLWLRAQGVSYDDAFKHVLRFQNSVSLGFPASEIESLKTELVDEPAGQTDHPARIAMTPAFIGLLGANGSLPLHYSERIANQQWHKKDDSARAFLDILSNRMVGLFFEAWGKYRLESRLDTQGVDPLRTMLEQLGGFKGADLPGRPPGERDVLAYYAAAFRTRPTSALAIAAVLTDYFGVRIDIEQFVGCWDELGASTRTVLGKATPTLGRGATLGQRLWRHDLRIRLNIGPLDGAERDRCLPNGEMAAAIRRMLQRFGLSNLQCEVRLLLKPECVRPVVLSANVSTQHRLGWGSFLTTVAGLPKQAEVRYLLPMHAARPKAGTALHEVSAHRSAPSSTRGCA